jgi:peptidoglycan/xylan/chitin deacetylase (PgdA/CDA1 family)
MLKLLKRATLHGMKTAGVFRAIKNSGWRKNRLLILCYHGIAQHDEHMWRPSLYMSPAVFEQRLAMIKRGGYSVLPLADALRRLSHGELPPRSVVLTFDDGGVDFYRCAFPLLRSYGFPATVYQTTYYSRNQWPVFNLMLSYLLWKRSGAVLNEGGHFGLPETMDLRTEESRAGIVAELVRRSEDQGCTGAQKHELTVRMARILGINYDELLSRRLLHLMTFDEIRQLAGEGIDFQLHTHRHRTPINEKLFRREIDDNRASLHGLGTEIVHFCYPSGVYRQEFLAWLTAEGVISATTCDADLVGARSNPLLLPRFVDTSECTQLEFEAWLTGVGALTAFRKAAHAVPPPAAGRASRIAAAE